MNTIDPLRAAQLLTMARRRVAVAQLHTAATTLVPKFEVAVRYAFAKGRKALGKPPDADRAADAIASALSTVLHPLLSTALRAGGTVAVNKLKKLRANAFNPDQERDEHGKWTDGGSSVDESEIAAAKSLGLPTTYHGKDSDKRFKGKAVDNPLPQSKQLTHEETKQLPINTRGQTKDVPISSLKSTQDYVQPTAVEYYRSGMYMKSQPVVATIRGEDILLNGNHNVVAAMKRGENSISIQHLGDLTEAADRIRSKRTLAGKRKVKFSFKHTSEAAVNWADKHAAELIAGISETSRERIANAIVDVLEEGDWESAYEDILLSVGSDVRARTIADHEVMTAMSEGQRLAWAQAVDEGYLTGNERRMWIATTDDDEKLCPVCESLDGTVAVLGEAYESKYDHDTYDGPPAHVGCRCTEGLT